METIKLIFAGMVIGIANVIPGVSGGTMAVVFGVYDRLIAVIALVTTLEIKKIFSQTKFWLPIGLGMGAGILFFSKAVQFLFEHYPVYTCFVFTGIVAGSIPLIYRRCVPSSVGNGEARCTEARTSIGTTEGMDNAGCIGAADTMGNGNGEITDNDATDATVGARQTAGSTAANGIPVRTATQKRAFLVPAFSVCVCVAASFVLMLVLAFYNTSSLSEGIAQTHLSFELSLKLLLGGALAAIAMIIPGISGSFLLLLLGIYATIIGAVADLNVAVLLVTAVGVVAGICGGAFIVQKLMQHVPFHTYGVILGLVAGSVFTVLPAKEFVYTINGVAFADTASAAVNGTPTAVFVVVCLLCFALGFALAFCQKEKEEAR